MKNIGRRTADSIIHIAWQPLAGDSIPVCIRVNGIDLMPTCLGCRVTFRRVGVICQHGLEYKTVGVEARVVAGRVTTLVIAWMPAP